MALTRRLLVDLLGVGDDPLHGLLLGGKTVDAALMAGVVADDNVPAAARLVGKGQHHGRFFSGLRHGAEICLVGPAWQAFEPASSQTRGTKMGLSRPPAGTKAAVGALRICQSTQWDVGNVT